MLIELRVKNFRSIRDEQVFSLVARKADKDHLNENTVSVPEQRFERIVRTAAIYGANASGKTNLIRALQYMKRLVTHSAIGHQPTASIAHTPFVFDHDTKDAPTELEVTFFTQGTRYQYGFVVDRNRVREEWMYTYPESKRRMIFVRTCDNKSEKSKYQFGKDFRGARSTWVDATRPNALFLSTAVQLNSESLKSAFEWFFSKLVVVAGGITLNQMLSIEQLKSPEGTQKVLSFLQAADLGISNLAIQNVSAPPQGNSTFLISVGAGVQRIRTMHKVIGSTEFAELDLSEESNGTQVLFNSAGAWLNVLSNGEVLVFDELDTSLHPLITQYLVRQFHSDQSNKSNAQLVFSTHDTSLLDSGMLRRDQIWLVEKDIDGVSTLSALSDFKVRKNEALEKRYLRGRYGAIPLVRDE